MDGKRTYDNQDLLPPLPVPNLENSIELYLETLSPFVPQLLTEDEYLNTKRVCQEFINGKGKILQAKLEEKGKREKNWLTDWWLTYGYHIWRDPTPINTNYFGLIETQYTPNSQIAAAASMAYLLLTPRFMFDNDLIPTQYMKKGTIPLDMDCYSYLFTGTRIPGETCDHYEKRQATDQVGIYVNNQLYFFPVCQDGVNLTEHSLEKQIAWIAHDSARTVPQHDVSILGTENRTVWAENRARLINLSANNADLVEEISNCLILITLDNRTPSDEDEFGLWTASSEKNKWWDKICQFVIYKNGWTGCIGEHSPCDAPYIAWCLQYCAEEMEKDAIDRTPQDFDLQKPVRRVFDINDEIASAIEEAITDYTPLRDDLDLSIFHYRGYGKLFIKEYGFSPDSYLQMALQLAYHKVYGRGCATYETGHTRKFFHGRTETVRSFSQESKDFCIAMTTKGVSPQERIEKLTIAIKRHKDYLVRVMDGQSCDRHLMGLRILEMESGDLPSEIFQDKAYTLSTTFLLSTSAMPADHYYPGFGPVTPLGYGFCYAVRPDNIAALCTARNQCEETSTKRFRDAMYEALDDMRTQILEANRAKL